MLQTPRWVCAQQLHDFEAITYWFVIADYWLFLKDCSASGNQKRREPPRGEADKAPMPTSLRQRFSSSLRVRYSMRNLLFTVIYGFEFIYNLGTFKVIGQPGFYLCDRVCMFVNDTSSTSMQHTWWTLSGNAVQSYWRIGTAWSAYFWMTHCQERKAWYCFHLNLLGWCMCKRSTLIILSMHAHIQLLQTDRRQPWLKLCCAPYARLLNATHLLEEAQERG